MWNIAYSTSHGVDVYAIFVTNSPTVTNTVSSVEFSMCLIFPPYWKSKLKKHETRLMLHCYQWSPGDHYHYRRSWLAWKWLQQHHTASKLKNHWNNRQEGLGDGERKRERGGVFWGTKQGHLPRAIWWLRWFYTVVFVCLFRLGLLPGSTAGQPSVIIYLPSSTPFHYHQPSLFLFFCLFVSVVILEIHLWLSLWLMTCVDWRGESIVEPLLITPHLNLWWNLDFNSTAWLFVHLAILI